MWMHYVGEEPAPEPAPSLAQEMATLLAAFDAKAAALRKEYGV